MNALSQASQLKLVGSPHLYWQIAGVFAPLDGANHLAHIQSALRKWSQIGNHVISVSLPKVLQFGPEEEKRDAWIISAAPEALLSGGKCQLDEAQIHNLADHMTKALGVKHVAVTIIPNATKAYELQAV
jgi:hypothetical protein